MRWAHEGRLHPADIPRAQPLPGSAAAAGPGPARRGLERAGAAAGLPGPAGCGGRDRPARRAGARRRDGDRGEERQTAAGPLPPDELYISSGHYDVHGRVCENEDLVLLDDQPDLPGVGLPADPGDYIAFLDVWHRLITSAENPALREVALGGPDTATRTRTVWQVRTRLAVDPLPPAIGSGHLRARADASGPVTSPVATPSTGTGYRRLDNQLYRVEIRDPGDPGQATFLWSRENGSVTARLLKKSGNDLVPGLDRPGRPGCRSTRAGWRSPTPSGCCAASRASWAASGTCRATP